VRIFKCNHCGQAAFFENTACERCGSALGFLLSEQKLIALEPGENGLFNEIDNKESRFRYCQNVRYKSCNWVIPSVDVNELCTACSLNQTIPNLSDNGNVELWAKLETAKHRLVYSLNKLRLPLKNRVSDPENGVAFDFLSDHDADRPVIMGHAKGVITINLNEADEVKRVALREKLHEPYRTIIGHFRHEIGHYYFDQLIAPREENLNTFRIIFGDEQVDYSEALNAYYKNGPVANWQNSFISAYATSHPWEDWAETWAHYLHVMDALEIAWSFGLAIDPDGIKRKEKMSAHFDEDPYSVQDFNKLIELWFPLSIALNSMNRSIGNSDFYPFIIPHLPQQRLPGTKYCR
jgi:hypothetical protein